MIPSGSSNHDLDAQICFSVFYWYVITMAMSKLLIIIILVWGEML